MQRSWRSFLLQRNERLQTTKETNRKRRLMVPRRPSGPKLHIQPSLRAQCHRSPRRQRPNPKKNPARERKQNTTPKRNKKDRKSVVEGESGDGGGRCSNRMN